MQDWGVYLPRRKLERWFVYLEQFGIAREQLIARSGVAPLLLEEESIDARTFSQVFQEGVNQLEASGRSLPWGGGVGGRAFRMLCYCLLSCRTLGQALERAEQFYQVVSETSDFITLHRHGRIIELRLEMREGAVRDDVVPRQRGDLDTDDFELIAKVSGLQTWHRFCGWLTGRMIRLNKISIPGLPIDPNYDHKLESWFGCPYDYCTEYASLWFDQTILEYPLVHTTESMEQFLALAPYELIIHERTQQSTSTAIRSLIGHRLADGLPSFEQVAQMLNMSPSSLRRRLLSEETSYQKIKDDCRRDTAEYYLRDPSLSIRQVGELIGFFEPSSFTRSFRSWTGMNPQAYRDQLNIEAEGDLSSALMGN